MKTIDHIPTSKMQRATKLVSTGAKVGVNYLKYYGDKLTKTEVQARAKLNENNAEDIYDGLKQLKGSALKVAQMLSMEKSILPQAYVDKFSLAQFSVPPLSPPLVIKTFKNYFGKHPNELYDTFNATSVNAASIGQVHIAEKDGKKLAVKIQYPGVAESISSDLSLVKPFAVKMFNLQGKDSEKYFATINQPAIPPQGVANGVQGAGGVGVPGPAPQGLPEQMAQPAGLPGQQVVPQGVQPPMGQTSGL
jgi:predicted unusual protein kinase regulating ubiquinone biosynthesis (AarF/ABC1/UbiB family)